MRRYVGEGDNEDGGGGWGRVMGECCASIIKANEDHWFSAADSSCPLVLWSPSCGSILHSGARMRYITSSHHLDLFSIQVFPLDCSCDTVLVRLLSDETVSRVVLLCYWVVK